MQPGLSVTRRSAPVLSTLLTTLDGLDRTATDEVLGATAIRVYQLAGLDT